jgi:hypothetical protein
VTAFATEEAKVVVHLTSELLLDEFALLLLLLLEEEEEEDLSLAFSILPELFS